MYKAVKKTKDILRYMEALSLLPTAPTVYWEENTSHIYVVETKIVSPRTKHIDTPICFLQEKLTMFSLLQNMRILVSCQKICAPNHVDVQLTVVVINGLMDSYSIQLVIQNSTN